MTWSSRMSRTVRVQVMFGLLAVIGVPSLAYSQANSPAELQARFDRAFAVFNSARQPEAIPQFSQLIDDLRAMPNRSGALTTLLARALQYRAQARENVGQTADADADLRLIREVAPNFRLTDPGLSASLVARFNALVPVTQPQQQAPPSPTPQVAPPPAQPAGPSSPKAITLSGGYQYLKENDCDDCKFPTGFYVDVAGQILPFLSWVGEVSGASGRCCFDSADQSAFFFAGGARVHPPLGARLVPFGQVLFGGGRFKFADEFEEFTESKGVVHVSGGTDYRVTNKLGARFGIGYVKMFNEFGSLSWIRVNVGVTVMLQ
jgi:hypothetical protein